MKPKLLLGVLFVLLVILLGSAVAEAQGPQPGVPRAPSVLAGNAFTYQGQLKRNGAAYSGTCSMQFTLYDAASGGGQIGTTQTAPSVTVTNGLFSTPINFGTGVFNGNKRFLQIAVMCGGDGGYTPLTALQELTPAPMALALPGFYTQQNTTSPNVIGGYSGNTVDSSLYGATIAGGGKSGGINHATGSFAAIAGGTDNVAGNLATIGGGDGNAANGQYSLVGGGDANTAGGQFSVVGGGISNDANGQRAFVGGGDNNTANGQWNVIGGGYGNSASNDAAAVGGGFQNVADHQYATVGGGHMNTASGDMATVCGGNGNTADGDSATVPGGIANTASGRGSFAAGVMANANADGNFTFADARNWPFTSTTPNSFRVRATGGVRFVVGINDSGGMTWSCSVFAGDGGWDCSSDRNLKENFIAIDGRTTLARLSKVPILQWNAKGLDPNVKHFGPMAQDFYAAFGLGNDDKSISTIDLDGVALSAIQGLNEIVHDQDAQIAQLKGQVDELQKQNQSLDARVTALEQATGTVSTNSLWNSGWILGGLLVAAMWFITRRGEDKR